MLLQALKQYADERMSDDLPPSLYAMTPVAYVVEIDGDGKVLSRRPVETIDPSTPRGKRGIDRLAPEIVRTSGLRPLLLADNSEYTFGRSRSGTATPKIEQAHRLYGDLVRECAEETREETVRAVTRFYEHGGVQQLDLPDTWDDGLKVTFRVHLPGGPIFPIDTVGVQQFWLNQNQPTNDPQPCHVCQQFRPPLSSIPVAVKGIRGGQSSGTALISVNAEAFQSYGTGAENGIPTCLDCGERFTRALNALLAGEQTHLAVGNTTFAFWTREPRAFDFASFVRDPSADAVRMLLDSARAGQVPLEVGQGKFYAVAFSGSGGRAVVRDWLDCTVEQARKRLVRWFQLQEVVDAWGEPHRPLGIFALAVSTVRRADDLPVTTPRALMQAAFAGTPLPINLAFEAVRRNRAEAGSTRIPDRPVTRQRAALIKLVLLSQGEYPEGYLVSLESDHPRAAYHCGRLLAVLEEVQRAAMPNVNASIVDRFFGSASSTPAAVFGRLLRGAQPHLARLERDRRGAYYALQERLEEITDRIDGRSGFPRTLTLEDQALFSLGYYHQRAHDRAEMASRRLATGDDSRATEPGSTASEQEGE